MKQAVLMAVLAALLSASIPTPAGAGPIGRACIASPRQQKTPQLCTCIQRVADQVLTRGEQRQAARFFSDPHRAQETRQSGSAAKARFWERYKVFATNAERICG
ncbi:hypothetical protein SAMN05216196_105146 [Lutimaribacter pacificus]|uniref:Arginine transporter n=1 Tax=Lutimaribacter pacificus TaxID=391948 RepID=A0A1H0J560_9RHOB|nr:hypothetical protein [Lutimaribacter pacificus]SDO38885.1 hypothetical protein SAMN05216196_105146 [Lutimaribacter pacificus]SHK13739.1 hypothetical protein SAMN05444142_103394 [Lutimaribacter pacificus]